MTTLTDSQLLLLTSAAARDNGAAMIPARMTKASASKVASSLIARKLMREVRQKAGMPIWRTDDAGRALSLVLLRAGRAAIPTDARREDDAGGETANVAPTIQGARPSSKRAQIIGLLSSQQGTTLDDLVKATGWLPHTTRAALTGLRKKGFDIVRQKGEGTSPSVYRILAAAA